MRLTRSSAFRVMLVVLAWVFLSAAASAHSTLVSVEPADGSILPAAPRSVQLRFNEPIVPAVIHLIDAAGRVRDPHVETRDDTIRVEIPPDLPRGTQVLSYRIISADGHPVSGSVVFSIGAPSGAPVDANRSDPLLAGAIWLARVGLYLGLFTGIGGAFFVAWFSVPGTTPLLAAALATGGVAAFVSLGLQGLDLLGLPFSALAGLSPWQAGWNTSLGSALGVALGGTLLAALALRSPVPTGARWLSSAALLSVGATLALSGHASTASPEWLTRTAILLHGLCIGFWVGALLPLLLMSARPGPELRAVLTRFSDIAIPLVGLLVLTGTILASVQMESPRAFLTTAYGRILAAKLTLVIALLGFAALNRFRFMASTRHSATTIRRSIGAECLLALLIFSLVAGWRFTTPPRALAAAAGTARVTLHMANAKAMVMGAVDPGRVGVNAFTLAPMAADADALLPKAVTLTVSLPAAGIEPIERSAALAADGLWHVDGVLLPQPGVWHLRVDLLVSDFAQETMESDFSVAAH